MAYSIPKISEKKKIANKLNKPSKEALDKFYDDALMNAPFHCENCGADLRESVLINPRVIVAHILPKKSSIGGFPSVATHPMNKFYAYSKCHNGYDEQGSDFILQMPLLQILKERVKLLIPYLTESEKNKIPEYLK